MECSARSPCFDLPLPRLLFSASNEPVELHFHRKLWCAGGSTFIITESNDKCPDILFSKVGRYVLDTFDLIYGVHLLASEILCYHAARDYVIVQ